MKSEQSNILFSLEPLPPLLKSQQIPINLRSRNEASNVLLYLVGNSIDISENENATFLHVIGAYSKFTIN